MLAFEFDYMEEVSLLCESIARCHSLAIDQCSFRVSELVAAARHIWMLCPVLRTKTKKVEYETGHGSFAVVRHRGTFIPSYHGTRLAEMGCAFTRIYA